MATQVRRTAHSRGVRGLLFAALEEPYGLPPEGRRRRRRAGGRADLFFSWTIVSDRRCVFVLVVLWDASSL